MARAKALNLALLSSIAAATVANSFVYVSNADAKPFLDFKPQPLIDQNPTPEGLNEKGERQTRTTDAGTAYSAANPPAAGATAAPAASAPKAKPVFALGKTQVDVPEIKRGGGVGAPTYPFDELGVKGDGSDKPNNFFVPATAERAEPAKALASTVSSATRRHAVPDGTKEVKQKDGTMKTVPNMKQTRKFVVRAEADGAAWGFPGVPGALIIRTQ